MAPTTVSVITASRRIAGSSGLARQVRQKFLTCAWPTLAATASSQVIPAASTSSRTARQNGQARMVAPQAHGLSSLPMSETSWPTPSTVRLLPMRMSRIVLPLWGRLMM
jgi:hypothetical protein